MKMIRHGILLGLLAAALPLRAAPLEKPVKVLLVDGFSNHNWRQDSAWIRSVLAASGRLELAVATSPPRADSPGWSEWRPRFADYDVVIQTCNNINRGPSWPEPVRRDFENFVRGGGGVLIHHSANNAFADWEAYNRIIGLGWRAANQGPAIAIDEDGGLVRIPSGQGRATSHGQRVDALITRIGSHPIHAGLPRSWMTPEVEVYSYARGPAQNLEVLSYAYDVKTDMRWPIEWTVRYGKGRVYAATYGHLWANETQPPRIRCAAVQTLMLRALWWLAGREEILAVPDDFPTATAVSIRPESPLPP